jgi:hypothetical protein
MWFLFPLDFLIQGHRPGKNGQVDVAAKSLPKHQRQSRAQFRNIKH